MIELLQVVVATAALAFAAVLAARRLRTPSDAGLDHALTGAVLFLAAVLVVSLALGLVGLYRAWPLTIAAVALAALVRLGLGSVERRPGKDGGLRERLRAAGRLVRREPLATAAVALATAGAANRALIALVLPPGGIDALAYHLVFVGDWVQRGEIGGSELQRAGCCAWYPVNAELTYAWLAVFPHSDRLVGLAQVGYLVLGALAVASISRSVGAAGRHAAVAGSLFALTPVALRQSSTNQVDVAFAAGVLLTAAFTLRLLREDAGRADVLRFALAAGFTLGVKATAAPYVAAAVLLLAGHWIVRRRRGRGPVGRTVLQAGVLVAVFLVLGVGWYLRAWIETGNPVWPYRVEVAGAVVFAGPRNPETANPTPAPLAGLPEPLHAPRSWLAELDLEGRMSTAPQRPDTRLGGLGPVWLLVGIPCALLALVLSLRRRDGRFAAFAFAVAVPALLATPDSWWSRFTIPLAAVGLAGFAYTATRLPVPAARGLTAVALALALVGVVETRPLGPVAELRRTPGVPLERPPQRAGGLDHGSLDALPEETRVGVVKANPLLFLVLGERFSREVVPLDGVRETPGTLSEAIEAERLEYVVSRGPLPEKIVAEAPLEIVARSSGAVVYRVEPGGRVPAVP